VLIIPQMVMIQKIIPMNKPIINPLSVAVNSVIEISVC